MATEVFLTRTLDGKLAPVSDDDRDAIMALPMGTVRRVELVSPRNYQRLKWWWKLCEIISDNAPEKWPSKKAADKMLKLKCGHFEIVIVPGKKPGEWTQQYQAGSIAYASMEEPDFKALQDKAVQVASEVLACEVEGLEDALNDFFSGKRAA